MCSISSAGRRTNKIADTSDYAPRGDGGSRRGRLLLVGIGPGPVDHLTRAAENALRSADVVVGYKPYLKMVAGLIRDARTLESGMRAEVDRARSAIEAAAAGETVAVVSSGDAGVYGMAGLVLELLGERDDIDVQVVPGVTAALAAASALGSPLTNDFACVSLSNLLTPLSVIERRIRALAESGLVMVVYNPRSATRTEPLGLALEILCLSRGPNTLVGVVRDACRDSQVVDITTLGKLDAESIDMSTVLIVGNAETRVIGNRMVTPRGYRV